MNKKDLKKEAEDFFGQQQPRRGNENGAPGPDLNQNDNRIQNHNRDQEARPSGGELGARERLTRPNGLSQSLDEIVKVRILIVMWQRSIAWTWT